MYQNTEMMRDEDVMRGEDEDDERRLLLIGKTGVGKSSTGNTIFNDHVFQSEMSSSSVTRRCQTHTDTVNNRRLTVIDTPDFKFSTDRDFDSDSELKRALESSSPGVHVILLILSLNTFTTQELDYVTWFEQMFGVEVFRYTIVLFTHADKSHRAVGALIRGNHQLSNFINRCGGGYCEMNNKDPSNRRQVTELLEKIDSMMSNNTNTCYSLEMLLETQRRAEEEKRGAEEQKRGEEERKEREREEELERVRRETQRHMKKEIEKLELAVLDTALIRKGSQQSEKKKIEEMTLKEEEPEKSENKIKKFKRKFRQIPWCRILVGGILCFGFASYSSSYYYYPFF